MKRTLFALALLCSCGIALAADPVRPDAKLTPGATVAVSVAKLCVRGYAKSVRNVGEAEKKQVFQRYGIAWSRHSSFEVDHLISLELGGANTVQNLWPQSYVSKPYNAHVKDKLEDHLHALVCHQKVSLAQAQHDISHDWMAAYKKYMSMKP